MDFAQKAIEESEAWKEKVESSEIDPDWQNGNESFLSPDVGQLIANLKVGEAGLDDYRNLSEDEKHQFHKFLLRHALNVIDKRPQDLQDFLKETEI